MRRLLWTLQTQRLLEEESDRVALEEQVFLLQRRNRALTIEVETLNIHLQNLQRHVQTVEAKAQRDARQPNSQQQIMTLQLETQRLRAERDQAQRQLAAVAKSGEPDFMASYLQLEDDVQGLLQDRTSLQARCIELQHFEQELLKNKLDTALLREQHDDLEFHVQQNLEPQIEQMVRELGARENTIHYLHQALADERQKNKELVARQ